VHSGSGACQPLCTTQTPPYQYVSVEGPITSTEYSVDVAERRATAHRYLGPEFGDLYLQATEAEAAQSLMFRMTPERWLTTDFKKQLA